MTYLIPQNYFPSQLLRFFSCNSTDFQIDSSVRTVAQLCTISSITSNRIFGSITSIDSNEKWNLFRVLTTQIILQITGCHQFRTKFNPGQWKWVSTARSKYSISAHNILPSAQLHLLSQNPNFQHRKLATTSHAGFSVAVNLSQSVQVIHKNQYELKKSKFKRWKQSAVCFLEGNLLS